MNKKLSACLIATCLTTAAAWADVRYTSKVSTPNAQGMEQSTTTYVKGKRQRDESVANMGPMKMTTITIMMCDKKQTVTLDPELKIYTVRAIGGAPPSAAKPAAPEAKGTGTLVTTYGVQDKGIEKIAKLDAHHWIVNTQYVSTGCAGDYDQKMKAEIWTVPAVQALNCPELWSSPPPVTQGCKVTYTMKGDVSKMQEAYKGMIAKQIFYNGDQVISTTELVDYSTAALSDSLFDVGPDFKLVTEAEYSAQQQQKMMKAYKVPQE